MNYERVAAAMLTEVGLSFDDVVDLGRPWIIGPPGLQMHIADPAYRGMCSYPNSGNPMSRQRCLISLSGPVDSDKMLFILAHECGHVLQDADISTPTYILEYQAEMYAIAAFHRHGVNVTDDIVDDAKRNVRHYCEFRYRELGERPTKGWDFGITAWCGFRFVGDDAA